MHQTVIVSLQALYYCNDVFKTPSVTPWVAWSFSSAHLATLHTADDDDQLFKCTICCKIALGWAVAQPLCNMALNEIQNVQYSKSEGTSPHWAAQLHDDSMWSLKRCTLCLVNFLAWKTHWYPMTCCLLTAWCAELQTTFSPDHWSLPWRLSLSLSRPLTPSPCIRTVIWFCSVVRV